MIVGDRILLIHFWLGEAIYKYLQYTIKEHLKTDSSMEVRESIRSPF